MKRSVDKGMREPQLSISYLRGQVSHWSRCRIMPLMLALLFALLIPGVSLAEPYAKIGGNGAYSPGGWGAYTVDEHGTIEFDTTTPGQWAHIDLEIDLTALRCDVETGTACLVNRTEQIRIDGEQAYSDPKYFFYRHDDEFDLSSTDMNHRNVVNDYACSNMWKTPDREGSVTSGEKTTASCWVVLPPGHHVIELYVDTFDRGGFGTHPKLFSETLEASVSLGSVTASFSELSFLEYPTLHAPAAISTTRALVASSQRSLQPNDASLQGWVMAATPNVSHLQASAALLTLQTQKAFAAAATAVGRAGAFYAIRLESGSKRTATG